MKCAGAAMLRTGGRVNMIVRGVMRQVTVSEQVAGVLGDLPKPWAQNHQQQGCGGVTDGTHFSRLTQTRHLCADKRLEEIEGRQPELNPNMTPPEPLRHPGEIDGEANHRT